MSAPVGNIAPLYGPGEVAVLHADLFPAAINPLPDNSPRGVKLRAIVTERGITLGWQQGSGVNGPIIGRMDIPLTPEETAGVSFRGGTAGPYRVTAGSGCKCGSRAVQSWSPFPGASDRQNPRRSLAQQQTEQGRRAGVPPQRYTRSRL